MDEQKNSNQPAPRGNKTWLWVAVIVLVLGAAGFYAFGLLKQDKDSDDTKSTTTGGEVSISQEILDNKFGWLGGGAEDSGQMIIENGGGWARPHPGAFVWDMMQKSKTGEIDFSLPDQEVKNYSKNNLGILATIWPFADWDQKSLTNAADCKVANDDEFLSKNDEKGRGSYLPEYRCNPSDWSAYQDFVEKIVERYDGDGVDDMPNLTIPVKYWEVMNEPDLRYQSSNVPENEGSSLSFYKQGPDEYAELLVNTSKAIRSVDPEAKILIAGAAGADSRMLGFYKSVFANKDTFGAFDIGNIHCISNDQRTNDFNVGPYKEMLEKAGITGKSIWVTEAEAVYSAVAEENYLSTKKSVEGAIAAGAERIFFTRYEFDDIRKNMSEKSSGGAYPSGEKYRDIIKLY
jgi:hypothetical protein